MILQFHLPLQMLPVLANKVIHLYSDSFSRHVVGLPMKYDVPYFWTEACISHTPHMQQVRVQKTDVCQPKFVSDDNVE